MMVVDSSSVLGLPAGRARTLLAPLGCGELDPERTLAFLIWSHLCEPGDMIAGRVVDKLGPIAALSALRTANPELNFTRELSTVDSADELLNAGAEGQSELRDACARWKARDNNSAVVRSLELWHRLGGQVITPDSSDWPEQFAALEYGRPHVLWLRGNRSALSFSDLTVSIVGSRNTSSYGQHVAQQLGERFATEGFVVISGGAYGIDAEAHRGALVAQGRTIAILAGGGDRLYPSGNAALLNEVMQSGCVIAELPPGHTPTRWRFLQRNRLIAALGAATVIVEMAVRSGAKNTMNHAAQMSRPIYAVPGSIVSQTSRGCNLAIQQGMATIVTSVDDLIRELSGVPELTSDEADLTALQQRVLDALVPTPVTPTRVSIKAGTSISETMSTLGQLEALGLAVSKTTGWRRTQVIRADDNNLRE